MSTVHTVIVQDAAGDIHETWVFDNDVEALKCAQHLSNEYIGNLSSEFSVSYGIHEVQTKFSPDGLDSPFFPRASE